MKARPICILFLLCIWHLPGYAAADAADIRRGQFELSYALSELLDQETLDLMVDVLEADEQVTWKMHVPESYDPMTPAGLMVYVSPSQKGWMPRGWQPVIDERNMIWISADQSGNEVVTVKRMLFAVLGPQIARQHYALDADRIYVSGFSGGGKIASMVAIDFANLFKGALYICGVLPWKQDPPAFFEQVKANRYVFLSGENDFNLDETKSVFRRYQRAGVENVDLIKILGMGHSTPNEKRFREALDFLDARDPDTHSVDDR